MIMLQDIYNVSRHHIYIYIYIIHTIFWYSWEYSVCHKRYERLFRYLSMSHKRTSICELTNIIFQKSEHCGNDNINCNENTRPKGSQYFKTVLFSV